MRTFATGFNDYIEEDRPQLIASFGKGNTDDELEVHLTFVDHETDAHEFQLGWYRVSDLQAIVNAAIHGREAA